MSQKLRELFAQLPPVDPPTEREIHEARIIDQQEPGVVTLCLTCQRVSYMMRLGCPYQDCPDQPFAVNITYRYDNHQGQLLRPGRDWASLESRPLTEWT